MEAYGYEIVKRVKWMMLKYNHLGEISSSERAFSNSLFLMLDALNDDQPLVRLAGRTWLADSINKLERILDPLLLVLLDPTTARYLSFTICSSEINLVYTRINQ